MQYLTAVGAPHARGTCGAGIIVSTWSVKMSAPLALSKAKLKRLNKIARFERIKSDLEKERKLRLPIEKAG